jgi:hypothetical protein
MLRYGEIALFTLIFLDVVNFATLSLYLNIFLGISHSQLLVGKCFPCLHCHLNFITNFSYDL